MEIEVPILKKVQVFLAKAYEINYFKNVMVIKLQIPEIQNFDFIPGQYIQIIHNNNSRFYSIANTTQNKQQIELHVRTYSQGLFTQQLWSNLNVGQAIKFYGPLGNFTLQNTESPILMAFTGTGFAPLKSIIEDMLLKHNNRKINLVCGNNRIDDFYIFNVFSHWQKYSNIQVTLCTSKEEYNGYYFGYVTDYVKHNFNHLTGYEVYACGSNKMINGLYNLSVNQLGLAKSKFYSDAF